MASSNRTRAIRIEQNNRVFYLAAVPAAQLLGVARVDVWHSGEEDPGYQRAPSQTRKNEIAEYFSRQDAVMPLGGLLNARSGNGNASAYGSVLEFAPDEGEGGPVMSGWLTLPGEDDPLWIVDMQHRLGGLETALARGEDVAHFPVVVTIADGLTKLEEIEQFELINTTQKKVRTDLARRLLEIRARDVNQRKLIDQQHKLWQAKGPVIVDWLNSTPGVWFGRIIEPNATRKERPNGVIKETSFVTSLKPVLSTPLLSRAPDEQVSELLALFWQVLADMWPDAFTRPEDHVVQKTPGIFSLHLIAPDAFELARHRGALDRESLTHVLRPLEELGSDFWHKTDGTAAQFGGMKGFSILAGELREYLPLIDLSLR
jgi:DGQHR domain-containing protein